MPSFVSLVCITINPPKVEKWKCKNNEKWAERRVGGYWRGGEV